MAVYGSVAMVIFRRTNSQNAPTLPASKRSMNMYAPMVRVVGYGVKGGISAPEALEHGVDRS